MVRGLGSPVAWVSGVMKKADSAAPLRHLLLPFKRGPDVSYKPITLFGDGQFDPDLVRAYVRLMDRAYEESLHQLNKRSYSPLMIR